MEGEEEGCLLKWTDLHLERKLTVKGVSSDFFFFPYFGICLLKDIILISEGKFLHVACS